ncbi:MAG: MFS transporter [Oscillospiraceae bacterium]|nr:MFS transporter [Oscillospiraceae bacterium]
MSTDKKFSGWSVFVACILLNTFATATCSGTAALFMNPICTELGFSFGSWGLNNLIGSLCSAGGAMWLAPKLGKGNMNKIMVICAIVTAITFGLSGMLTALWQFYLVLGICNIALAGLTQLPTSMLLTAWFEDKRSTVLAIAFAGNSIGTMIWAKIFAIFMAQPGGWRTCYFIGAISLAVVVIPVCLFMVKKAPALYGQEAYRDANKKSADGAAAKKADAWEGVTKKVATKSSAYLFFVLSIILIGMMVAGVATHAINFVMVPLENGGGGWSVDMGANLQAAYSFAALILVTFVSGPMFDKIGVVKGGTISCIAAALGIACLYVVSMSGSVAAGFGWAVLMGLAGGLAKLYASLMTSVLFGTKEYGAIYSLVNLFFLVGCSVGSVFTGVVADMAGYGMAWLCYIVMVVLAAVCINLAAKASLKLRAEYPNAPVAAE